MEFYSWGCSVNALEYSRCLMKNRRINLRQVRNVYNLIGGRCGLDGLILHSAGTFDGVDPFGRAHHRGVVTAAVDAVILGAVIGSRASAGFVGSGLLGLVRGFVACRHPGQGRVRLVSIGESRKETHFE